MLTENVIEVEKHVQAACDRAGRSRDEVTLIAVSKTKPVEMIMASMISVSSGVMRCRRQSSMACRPQRTMGSAHMELRAMPMASEWAGMSFREEMVHS